MMSSDFSDQRVENTKRRFYCNNGCLNNGDYCLPLSPFNHCTIDGKGDTEYPGGGLLL